MYFRINDGNIKSNIMPVVTPSIELRAWWRFVVPLRAWPVIKTNLFGYVKNSRSMSLRLGKIQSSIIIKNLFIGIKTL